MQIQDLKKYNLPDTPGVYMFLNGRKKILYIGRATSLFDRVKSYFSRDLIAARGPLITKMVSDAVSIDWRETDSVLEAILLEADLIKKFRPDFNTAEKDDKSFNCVVVTDEDYPRILIVRKRDLDSKQNYGSTGSPLKVVYGPFTEGFKLQIALKIIRKIFPFRDGKCIPFTEQAKFAKGKSPDSLSEFRGKPCFNRQIGMCPGVCTGEVTRQEYTKTVRNIMRLFEGKKKEIVRSLAHDMKRYARAQEFEKAHYSKKTIFALEHIQDVALISSSRESNGKVVRVEAFDVAHTSGKETVGVMTAVIGGVPAKSFYRMFKIKGATAGDDISALREVLIRRLRHVEWGIPDIIVTDGGTAQLNICKEILELNNLSIPIVSVVKDERHRPSTFLGDKSSVAEFRKDILLANQEAHRFALSFHRRRRDKISK